MKTKLFFVVIALISVVAFSSCESKSGRRERETKNNSITTETVETVRVSQLEYDSLVREAKKVENLQKEKEDMEKFISNLQKNPGFFLLVLDAELSATETGEETYGSFTDFFIPTIHEALDAGVSKVEIQKRINRLIELARHGIFLSSIEEELYKEGGTKAIVQAIGLDE